MCCNSAPSTFFPRPSAVPRGKPSGTRSFIIQYRNLEGRTRRCVIGQYGVLTVEQARDHAKKKLASVEELGRAVHAVCSQRIIQLQESTDGS